MDFNLFTAKILWKHASRGATHLPKYMDSWREGIDGERYKGTTGQQRRLEFFFFQNRVSSYLTLVQHIACWQSFGTSIWLEVIGHGKNDWMCWCGSYQLWSYVMVETGRDETQRYQECFQICYKTRMDPLVIPQLYRHLISDFSSCLAYNIDELICSSLRSFTKEPRHMKQTWQSSPHNYDHSKETIPRVSTQRLSRLFLQLLVLSEQDYNAIRWL